MREPEAAVAIVRTQGQDSTILLMRRAERAGDSWSGHWSLPGGRKDGSDRDLVETALRELREECGLLLAREQLSAALPVTVARRHTGPFLLVAPFVFDVQNELPTVPDQREAVEAVWVPARRLLDPDQHSLLPAPGQPPEVRFPAVAMPGAPLWGFTYRLLADWLHVAPRGSGTEGFEAAKIVLEFLLAQGLTVRQGWHRSGQAQVTLVDGPIPAEPVLARFSAPGPWVAKVNRFEVRPQRIRIHGLAFEEYLIEAVAD